MAYPGLESIYQNENPYTGAMIRGQREAMAGVADLQGLFKNQQDYDRAEQMNPLDIQHRAGQVARQPAELEELTLRNKKTAGTLDSSIDEINEGNRVKLLDHFGQLAGRAGALLSSVPEGLERQTMAGNMLKQYNIDPNSTIGKYVLNNDPSKLIEVSGKLSKMRDAFIQAEMQKQMALEQEELRQAGATQREDMAIKAGKYKKSIRGAQDKLTEALVSGSWDKAATAYDYMAQQAIAAGDQEDALYYQSKAKEYSDKYAQTRPGGQPAAGAPNLGQMGNIPTNPQPTTPMPSLPGQAPAKAQEAPMQIKQQVEAAGWAFEPDKYEYRINPQTGKVQRKAK